VSRDQDRRNEFAQEQGYDTYAQYQAEYREIRDTQREAGVERDPAEIREMLSFERDFESLSEDERKHDALQEWFYEHFGEDEAAFYAYLHSLYE